MTERNVLVVNGPTGRMFPQVLINHSEEPPLPIPTINELIDAEIDDEETETEAVANADGEPPLPLPSNWADYN